MRKLTLLALLLILAACTPAPAKTPPSQSSSSGFVTVRNTCGACGTNSPIGGWEKADGQTLILAANGNFTTYYPDGSSISGTWKLTGSQLCLTIYGSTNPQCFSYEQKIDAMKLNDAIYIRE